MKSLRVEKHDQDPVFLDMSVPVVSPGSIKVKIQACGLNFADLLLIRGTYQETPPLPFTLGMEVAGVVSQVGQGVSGFAPGDMVVVYGGSGGLAEWGVFPASCCIKVPAGIDAPTAAGLMIAYGTSHLALVDRAKLQAGETLLVLGAAGGVGLTAVEIGHALGARVIAVARGAEKLAICKQFGADHVIDSTDADIRTVVKSLGGADVVYDPVGGAAFNAALRACNPEARYLTIGFASGDVPQIPANILLVKNITVQGFYWGGVAKYAPERFFGSLTAVMDMVATGALSPQVRHVYPFDQALDALDLLRRRASTGKVVVTMP